MPDHASIGDITASLQRVRDREAALEALLRTVHDLIDARDQLSRLIARASQSPHEMTGGVLAEWQLGLEDVAKRIQSIIRPV